MEEEMSSRRVREKRRQEKVAFMQALRNSINERKEDKPEREAENTSVPGNTKKPAKKSTKSTKKTGKK